MPDDTKLMELDEALAVLATYTLQGGVRAEVVEHARATVFRYAKRAMDRTQRELEARRTVKPPEDGLMDGYICTCGKIFMTEENVNAHVYRSEPPQLHRYDGIVKVHVSRVKS